MAIEFKGGDGFETAAPRALFRACSTTQTLRRAEEYYDIATDGKRFLMSCLTGKESRPS